MLCQHKSYIYVQRHMPELAKPFHTIYVLSDKPKATQKGRNVSMFEYSAGLLLLWCVKACNSGKLREVVHHLIC